MTKRNKKDVPGGDMIDLGQVWRDDGDLTRAGDRKNTGDPILDRLVALAQEIDDTRLDRHTARTA
jgi:hypothetical protein